MLKLSLLEINGFKAADRYARIEFSSDSISVIYGDNGSGKTAEAS